MAIVIFLYFKAVPAEILMLLLFFVVSVFMVVIASRRKRQAAQSSVWASTKGKIKTSQVSEHRGYDALQEKVVNSVFPELIYEYDVGGVVYSGSRYSFANAYSLEESKSICDKYKANDVIDVYYNPDSPADAVLVRGGHADLDVLSRVGKLLAVGSLVGVVIYSVLHYVSG